MIYETHLRDRMVAPWQGGVAVRSRVLAVGALVLGPASIIGSQGVAAAQPSGSTQNGAIVAKPLLSGVTPLYVPSNFSGTSVTLTGSDLGGATSVQYGSSAGTITSDTASSLTFTAPSMYGVDNVTIPVTVTTPGGTSNPEQVHLYFAPCGGSCPFTPVLDTISPSSGPASGGTTVTVGGVNLGSASAVDFGTTPAQIVSDTATSVTVVAPAGGANSSTSVTVTTPVAVSNGLTFTYAGPAGPPVSRPPGPVTPGQPPFVEKAHPPVVSPPVVTPQGDPSPTPERPGNGEGDQTRTTVSPYHSRHLQGEHWRDGWRATTQEHWRDGRRTSPKNP